MVANFRTSSVACLALLCAAAGLRAQDAAKGAGLLAEARQAVGGDARLAAVKTLDVRGEFKRLAGQTTIDGELQIRVELPDKWRRDEDLSPPGGGPAIIRTEVLNGSTVWEENSGRGGFFVGGFGRFGRGDRGGGGGFGGGGGGGRDGRGDAPVDPAQIEAAQRRAWRGELTRFLLAWLLTADGQVAWVATAEAPEGRADVLEITSSDAPSMRLFLDQTSHLPLMITWQGAAPQFVAAGRRGGGGRGDDGRGDGGRGGRGDAGRGGQQVSLQMTLAEYKTVNGLRLPHRITRGTNDMTTEEWTIDSYRINQTFRADVFTK
jgi:hypothetical protein